VKAKAAALFSRWLCSDEAKGIISSFRGKGKILFHFIEQE